MNELERIKHFERGQDILKGSFTDCSLAISFVIRKFEKLNTIENMSIDELNEFKGQVKKDLEYFKDLKRNYFEYVMDSITYMNNTKK